MKIEIKKLTKEIWIMNIRDEKSGLLGTIQGRKEELQKIKNAIMESNKSEV